MKWRAFCRVVLAVVLMSSLVLAGCGTGTFSQGEGKLVVTATTGMVADLAKSVGGDLVQVESLMGPGVDPHLYKASQGDIDKMTKADLVLYNGLHLEGKMIEVFERIGQSKRAIAVADGIPKEKLHHPPEFEGNPDPHIWFDVQLWMLAMERVKEGLIAEAPEHKEAFEKNAAAYRKELEVLDAYARTQLQTVPQEQRVLVTAHDAFGYFGQAYGLEVEGLQGISTDAEYGLKDVQNLVSSLVKRKIKAVFIESSVPKKAIEAVVEGAKAKGHEVKVGGELFSDAMGDSGTPEGTYLGMVRHNVDTVVAALK